jgi:peptide deformylase
MNMKSLMKTEFGDPILRTQARSLKLEEIKSAKIQTLIKNMRQTLISEKLGVGIAAPQVGQGLALSVIAVRSTKHRPNVEKFDLVIINPVIVKTYGDKKQMWEGCLSAGESGLFGKVERYSKVQIKYHDETGQRHTRQFSGLRAQIMQHEIDHLKGVLFMDHVRDPKTYMTLKEYKKRIVAKRV